MEKNFFCPIGKSALGGPNACRKEMCIRDRAYITRADEGPFPTELFGGEAQELRDRGNEYEMSTGLARRVGWFDGVMGRLRCV